MDHRVDYSIFAQVYDRLMDKDMYPRWQHYVQSSMPVGMTGTLLDLGCGSGDFAVQMAQAGWTVTGLDLSPEMLTLAEARAEQAGVDVTWVQGDMRRLAGLGTFDAVTSFDDSFCYLPDLTAVQETLLAAAGVLVPGGYFFCDVHSLPHSVEHELTFFTYDEEIDGYTRAMEIQHERTYPLADYQRGLTQAGLIDVQATADFGTAPVTADTTRWFLQGIRPHA